MTRAQKHFLSVAVDLTASDEAIATVKTTIEDHLQWGQNWRLSAALLYGVVPPLSRGVPRTGLHKYVDEQVRLHTSRQFLMRSRP